MFVIWREVNYRIPMRHNCRSNKVVLWVTTFLVTNKHFLRRYSTLRRQFPIKLQSFKGQIKLSLPRRTTLPAALRADTFTQSGYGAGSLSWVEAGQMGSIQQCCQRNGGGVQCCQVRGPASVANMSPAVRCTLGLYVHLLQPT
ncbi:hypothetical protein J6590_036100 [Homalodisca vitripennis]|nr:hypothetical protein J6590_036100 [Homalodisca vitripennis]